MGGQCLYILFAEGPRSTSAIYRIRTSGISGGRSTSCGSIPENESDAEFLEAKHCQRLANLGKEEPTTGIESVTPTSRKWCSAS